MIELLSYITEDNIVELDSRKYDEYTPVLIRQCLSDFPVSEQESIIASVKHINKKKDLNLTKGFALLHFRLDTIPGIRLSVGILPPPEKEGKTETACAVFCIIIPDAQCRTYLSLMAHLTRLLSKPGAKMLFHKGNKKEIVEFIHDFEKVEVNDAPVDNNP